MWQIPPTLSTYNSQNHLVCLTAFMGQEWLVSLGNSGLGVSWAIVGCWPKLRSSEGFTGQRICFPRGSLLWLSDWCQVFEKPQAFLHVDLFTELLDHLHNMSAGFPRASDSTGQSRSPMPFITRLRNHWLSYFVHCTILVTALIQCTMELCEGVHTSKWGSLETILELGYQRCPSESWLTNRLKNVIGHRIDKYYHLQQVSFY